MILEWKKELLRKKNWIILGVVIVLCIGIGIVIHIQETYNEKIKEYNYTHNIELLQEFIKDKESILEENGSNKEIEQALEEDQKKLYLYEAMLDALEDGDWKQELKLNIEQLEEDIVAYHNGNLVGITEEELIKQQQQYTFLYENEIQPQDVNETVTGWNLVYMLFQGTILPNFLPLIFILFCIDMMSVEQEQKTMKLLLLQPISRRTILRRKLMAGLAHTISLVIVIVIVTFIAGSILGGVGDLRYPLDMNPIFGSDQEILSLKDYFLQSIPLWLCSIFFYVSVAFLISTICLNSMVATIIGIIAVEGGFSVMKIAKDSVFIYEPFYIGNIGELFKTEHTPNGWIVMGILIVSAIVCIGISNYVLKKKEFYL
mgnify:FL=1